jgi:hypothetical protein
MRATDRSGNTSSWVYTGLNMNAYVGIPAGTMSVQDSTNVAVSAIKTGAAGASSVRQVLARYPFDIVPTLAGGSPEESINVDLSNRGFTTKPDGTTGSINVSSGTTLLCRYDWDDAGNSSTNAVLKVRTADGSNLGAGAVRLQGEFFEYT